MSGPEALPVASLIGVAAMIAGVLLLIGLLTPIVGAMIGAGAAGVALSSLPACVPNVFDSKLAVVFALTILLSLIGLGPGAFSADARLFGRREIIIPPAAPQSHG